LPGRGRNRNLGPRVQPAQGFDGPQIRLEDLDVKRLLAIGRGLGAVRFFGARAELQLAEGDLVAGRRDDVFQVHSLQMMDELLGLQLRGDIRVFARVLGEPLADVFDDLADAATADFKQLGELLVYEALDFGQAKDFEV